MTTLSLYTKGSFLFSGGCVFFTVDAIRSRNYIVLAGCILFDLGCVYFVADSFEESKFKGAINNSLDLEK